MLRCDLSVEHRATVAYLVLREKAGGAFQGHSNRVAFDSDWFRVGVFPSVVSGFGEKGESDIATFFFCCAIQ